MIIGQKTAASDRGSGFSFALAVCAPSAVRKERYLLRLVIFALISQPFYFRLAFGRAPEGILEYYTHWNVMLTLAVALTCLILIES